MGLGQSMAIEGQQPQQTAPTPQAPQQKQSAGGSGLIGGALGGIAGIANLFMAKSNADRQWRREKEAMEIQQQNQQELNKFNQELQLDTWNKTNFEAQRKHLENAGLSVGMMYGGQGAGGAIQGNSGGQAGAPNAPQQQNSNIVQDMGMALQLQLLQAQKENIQADTRQKNAQASTTEESKPYTVENLRQTGIGQWLTNTIEEYKRKNPNDDGIEAIRNSVYNKVGTINENSLKAQELSTELIKTIAEKDNVIANTLLTNEKAKGYWQELINATANSQSEKIKATAIKLATEWGTGEYTNWKTWVELGKNALDTIIKIAK